jgi:hypothetical protein
MNKINVCCCCYGSQVAQICSDGMEDYIVVTRKWGAKEGRRITKLSRINLINSTFCTSLRENLHNINKIKLCRSNWRIEREARARASETLFCLSFHSLPTMRVFPIIDFETFSLAPVVVSCCFHDVVRNEMRDLKFFF